MHRRRFMALSAAAAGSGLLASTAPKALAMPANNARPGRALNVLFLGGTGYLGPYVVERLVQQGHAVTLFNRGNRTDTLFPELEFIEGNRIPGEAPGLDNLRAEVQAGRKWDIVIDTASVHRWVEDTADLLQSAAAFYQLVSTMSVYVSNAEPGVDEDDPVHTMPDEEADKIVSPRYNMAFYGAVKARCEAAVRKFFPQSGSIVRPGLIVGPKDPTGRFTYWPWRISKGGSILAPGSGDDFVQVIDVRDTADFMVKLIADRTAGTFNALTDPGTLTMRRMLEDSRAAIGATADFVWAPLDFLQANQVAPWSDMPAWIPNQGPYAGAGQRSNARGRAAGLTPRPIGETARDTAAWYNALPEDHPVRGRMQGLTIEREAQLLERLAEQNG
jgi:2'-hydroxyisoflavone reductase